VRRVTVLAFIIARDETSCKNGFGYSASLR